MSQPKTKGKPCQSKTIASELFFREIAVIGLSLSAPAAILANCFDVDTHHWFGLMIRCILFDSGDIMVDIVNRQRKIALRPEYFLDFAERAAGLIPQARGRGLTIAFVSDRKMIELNRSFRGKPATTDVLSFPWEGIDTSGDANASDAEPYLGDIVISAEQAKAQAAENDLTIETEVKQLILHGILHLSGFDHESDDGEMNELELELRDKLLIS